MTACVMGNHRVRARVVYNNFTKLCEAFVMDCIFKFFSSSKSKSHSDLPSDCTHYSNCSSKYNNHAHSNQTYPYKLLM